MKRKIRLPGAVFLLCLLLVAGCGSRAENKQESIQAEEAPTKVVHYVSGKLGDKSFFDSADRGLKKGEMVFGFEATTIVGGSESEAWGPDLERLAASREYDIIIVGTLPVAETVKQLAIRYPEQRFIFYDDAVEGTDNVYSILYSQSEGSFLAGAFAAMVTTSTELRGTNPDKVIGFIGGMDDNVINDFKSGYEQGAAYIDPEVEVVAHYIGDFANAAKAAELAATQFREHKADIIYNVAGGAGLGILKAGSEAGKYTIGVDSNQNPLYPGSVLTSMLKNVDESVFRALSLMRGGNLPFGEPEVLGVTEGAVGLARDPLYEQYVPYEIREKMKEIELDIASGKIDVKSEMTKVEPPPAETR